MNTAGFSHDWGATVAFAGTFAGTLPKRSWSIPGVEKAAVVDVMAAGLASLILARRMACRA